MKGFVIGEESSQEALWAHQNHLLKENFLSNYRKISQGTVQINITPGSNARWSGRLDKYPVINGDAS